MSEEERESLYITLKSLFKEVSKEASLVGKVSLTSLSNQLALATEREICNLKEISYTLYWLSFLIYWKAEWFFMKSSDKKQSKISFKERNSSQKVSKNSFLTKEIKSLVLYLEHRTFKSLALNRKESQAKIDPLREEQLREIYNNLKKEKAKKQNLSHISIQNSNIAPFLNEWESFLENWQEGVSFNEKISSFSLQEKSLAFMDILQRHKKGELLIKQEGVNQDLFLGKLKKEVLQSYG